MQHFRTKGAITLLLAVTGCCWYFSCNRYGGNPLHSKPELAAGFGEIRPDHFHLGADLRTQGREGLPVYAVASGYVQRISVQPSGYGKVLYIQHPGKQQVTLYAHLSAFRPDIEEWVSERQYSQHSWQQELQPEEQAFHVTKGQLIGYSGNTGTSQGPHLHFEVRNTAGNKSSNPLLSSLQVKDQQPPVIEQLYWYDRGNSLYETTGKRISTSHTKVPVPVVGIGLQAFDQFTIGKFKTGIYQALLYKDEVLQYRFTLAELSQADSRYVNACIDYGRAIDSGQIVQLLFSLPGNRLHFARSFSARGAIDLSDQRLHRIKVVVTDLAGNETEKSCTLQYNGARPYLPPHRQSQLLYPDRAALLQQQEAYVKFSAASFYDVVPFQLIAHKATAPQPASVLIQLHNATVPVHDSFTIGIRTTLPVNSPLRNRTVLVLNNRKNKTIVKGIWRGNYLEAQLNKLGNAWLQTDTTPPEIVSQQVVNGRITVTCRDNLGDIAFFEGEAGKQWLAFARKGNVFTYTPDAHWPSGTQSIRITLKDVAGNSTVTSLYLPRQKISNKAGFVIARKE